MGALPSSPWQSTQDWPVALPLAWASCSPASTWPLGRPADEMVWPSARSEDECPAGVSLPEHPASTSAEASAMARREADRVMTRSEEHTSELQSLMSISNAVLCSNKKNK